MLRSLVGSEMCIRDSTKSKILQLANRQAAFLNNIQDAKSWEIANLDHPNRRSNKTLRQCIMEIQSKAYPHLSLFHSVDTTFRDSYSTQFTFIPQVADEARTMVAALLPYLLYKEGSWVAKHFNPSAVERSSQCKWDPVKQQVWSEDDDRVEEIMALDSEFHFSEVSVDKVPPLPASSTGTAALVETEGDSVSTFHPNGGKNSMHKAKAKRPNPSDTASTNQSTNSSTQGSQTSSVSLTSRISSLRSDLRSELSNQVSQQLQTFQTEMTKNIQTIIQQSLNAALVKDQQPDKQATAASTGGSSGAAGQS